MRVRYVCTLRKEMCQKNVRATQSVCTHAVAPVATSCVRNLIFSNKTFKFHPSMSIPIPTTKTCSTSLLSTNCQMYELMLLGFPRHALHLILDVAFVWNLNLRFGLPRSTISNCERAIKASRDSLGPDRRGNYFASLILFSDLLLCSC